jgi:RHS repeat-associated protein
MTKTLLRAGALSCALLATTALSAPARAQTGAPTPPVYQHVDENGVDLVTGDFHFSIVEGSIGSGAGAMALANDWGTYKGDNYNRTLMRSVSNGTARLTLVTGTSSRTFTGPASGSSFASDQGTGDRLVKAAPALYRLTEADGTVTEFSQPGGGSLAVGGMCAAGSETNCRLLGLSTTAPSGASIAYDWLVEERCREEQGLSLEPETVCGTYYRLAGIANNAGTSIAYDYADDSSLGTPGPDWYKRSGATLSSISGGSAATSYTFVSPTVTEVTDIGGRTWRLTRDAANRLVGIRRPGSDADNISIGYFANGMTVTRDGVATTYARSSADGIGTMVVSHALGQRLVVSNLQIGRPTQFVDELQRSTLVAYDGAGRVSQVTMPGGNRIDVHYDARGNVTQQVLSAAATAFDGEEDIVTSATYAPACTNPATCNRPLTTTDARGGVTEYEYDQTHGGVTRVIAPAPTGGAPRPETRIAYATVNGMVLPSGSSACQTQANCIGTADEVRTLVAYNEDLSVASVTTRDGTGALAATESYGYDPIGNLTSVDGPLAGSDDIVHFRYDAARQRVGTISPDPDGNGPLKRRAGRTLYRPDGQARRIETGTVEGADDSAWAAFAPLDAVEIGFDANDRPTTSTLATGGDERPLTQTSYDALGRTRCVAQRMNPAAYGALPASACQQGPAGAFGPDRIVETVRDAAGQVTEVRSAVGTALEAPEVRTSYDLNGRAQTVTDAADNRTAYDYDGHGRLRRTRFPVAAAGALQSSATDVEEQSYDAAGNVTRFTNRAGETASFSYDALGRRTGVDRPGSEPDLAFGYDLLGRTISAAQAGNALTFGYDALGRQVTQTGAHGTISSAYDAAGRRTRITHPDGYFVDQEYLVTGEMKAIRENGAASGLGVVAAFGYDDRGRRTSLTRGNGVVTSYAYDAASRLDSIAHDLADSENDLTLGFDHNPASQIVINRRSNDLYGFAPAAAAAASSHDGLNRIATEGGQPVAYDSRGNLTAEGGRTFGYGSDNRLISMTGGGRTYGFAYDPAGRLHEVTASGLASRSYAWDGNDAIVTYANGQFLARTVYGPGENEPLYQVDNQGRRIWFAHDERGSTVGSSDTAGASGARKAYDEYGNTTSGAYQHGYTGALHLRTTGLYYMRARIYDPKLGRFLQPDPIGYGDGMNMYAYVGGDPVNARDPSGLKAGFEPPLGSRIPRADGPGGGICGSCSGGSGFLVGVDNGVPLIGGYFQRVRPNAPAATLGNNTLQVTASLVWVPPQFGLSSSFFGGMIDIGRPAILHRLAVPYGGVSFCPNPTVGSSNPWNPAGRINSGKPGDLQTALSDMDAVATLNGLAPTSAVMTEVRLMQQALRSPIPIALRGGWYGYVSDTNYFTVTNSGLQMRFHRTTGAIRIDIPAGFMVPFGRLAENETCHYWQ